MVVVVTVGTMVKVGSVCSRLGLTKILDLVTLSSIEIVAFSEMM